MGKRLRFFFTIFSTSVSVRSSVNDMGWVFIIGTIVIHPLSVHVGEAGLFVEPGRDRCRRGFLGKLCWW